MWSVDAAWHGLVPGRPGEYGYFEAGLFRKDVLSISMNCFPCRHGFACLTRMPRGVR
jgi:hypothetical protein